MIDLQMQAFILSSLPVTTSQKSLGRAKNVGFPLKTLTV
ncbi:hypothetical protein DB29_04054 [Shouchella clausii]|nr:hypothetical protein DB29_04054 [Shouchella clausii]